MKEKILRESREMFERIDEVSIANTEKILRVFRESRVSDAHFRTTSGYAYDDLGREKLDEVYAKIFGAESALVRTQFASGTHALATVLFGILRPGDELVSVTGSPYDTMQTVIKSMEEFQISYRELPCKCSDGMEYFEQILNFANDLIRDHEISYNHLSRLLLRKFGGAIEPWHESIWKILRAYPRDRKFDAKLVSAMYRVILEWMETNKFMHKKLFEDELTQIDKFMRVDEAFRCSLDEDFFYDFEPLIRELSEEKLLQFKNKINLASSVDFEKIPEMISNRTRMVLIQRSKGYTSRESLSVEEIGRICDEVHRVKPDCICFVDNCYGEFVETREPSEAGADILAGSLIKNPGGGLAPTGGYIAGRKDLVELASYRLTAPGIGSEVGASLYDNRILFQGLFLSPHVVAQALKGSIFAAGIFSELGYRVFPEFKSPRFDIIQAIDLESPEKLKAFCRGIQKFSPVDSFATPEPWDMPGYEDQIIMAAGTFVQGASIELSADAPMRDPYRVYLQGGLTFEHAMLGILGAAAEIERLN